MLLDLKIEMYVKSFKQRVVYFKYLDFDVFFFLLVNVNGFLVEFKIIVVGFVRGEKVNFFFLVSVRIFC